MAQTHTSGPLDHLLSNLRELLASAGAAQANVIRIPSSQAEKPSPRLSSQAEDLIPQAKEIRAAYRIPYWEAVILLAEVHGVALPPGMLAATGFHRSREGYFSWTVDVSSGFSEQIRKIVADLEPTDMVAISSQVVSQRGQESHLPMVDLRIKHSETSLDTASAVFQALGVSGTLMQTENSYHFYGDSLFTDDELTTFLARASLFAPIVDQRWIAHQLIDRHCALRISPSINGTVPTFCRRVTASTSPGPF